MVITGSDHVSEINGSLVYLHHPSCLCVGLQEAELQVGVQLPVLAPSLLGGREEWRRLFLYSAMKSRLCLPVSMTTTLLQYSAVGRPLHLKAFPSGVSVVLCIFFSRFSSSTTSSSSSSSTVCVCFRSCISSSFSNDTSFASKSGLKFPRLHIQICSLHTFGCL